MKNLQGPKVLVVSNLYPLNSEKGDQGRSFAVKNLIDDAVYEGLHVIGVVRLPSLLRMKSLKTRCFYEDEVKVFDMPRFGARDYIFSKLTMLLSNRRVKNLVPDIVVCHMATNFYFAKKLFGNSPKYVYVLHQSDFKSRLLAYAVAESDEILVRSQSLRSRLLDELPGTKVSGVVGSGVDVGIANTKTLGFVDSNVLNFVFAGRLIALKNLEVILGALAKLKRKGHDFVFRILGDGPMRTVLTEKAENLGISENVVFYGHVNKSEVISVMKKSHLFVMPSAPETFGLAYLEAMSQGCVVIGHKGWGIDGLVEDGVQGFMVDSPNEEQVLTCFLRYINLSLESKLKMHEMAYELAKKNDRAAAGRNYMRLVEMVAKK